MSKRNKNGELRITPGTGIKGENEESFERQILLNIGYDIGYQKKKKTQSILRFGYLIRIFISSRCPQHKRNEINFSIEVFH